MANIGSTWHRASPCRGRRDLWLKEPTPPGCALVRAVAVNGQRPSSRSTAPMGTFYRTRSTGRGTRWTRFWHKAKMPEMSPHPRLDRRDVQERLSFARTRADELQALPAEASADSQERAQNVSSSHRRPRPSRGSRVAPPRNSRRFRSTLHSLRSHRFGLRPLRPRWLRGRPRFPRG